MDQMDALERTVRYDGTFQLQELEGRAHISSNYHRQGVKEQDGDFLWAAVCCPVCRLGRGFLKRVKRNIRLPLQRAKGERDIFRSGESCGEISSVIGCADGRRGEVQSQGRSSLFLPSPLIPCYPNTHHSSVTLGNEGNIFHICLIPSTCLPVHLEAIPFFVVAWKCGPVVLGSSGERLGHKYDQEEGGLNSHWGQLC